VRWQNKIEFLSNRRSTVWFSRLWSFAWLLHSDRAYEFTWVHHRP